jgi:hypothetical protein
MHVARRSIIRANVRIKRRGQVSRQICPASACLSQPRSDMVGKLPGRASIALAIHDDLDQVIVRSSASRPYALDHSPVVDPQAAFRRREPVTTVR